ncbi:cuticle protein AM/CP1114-like [Penaeus japonicus]|uniref:cuticle protein AM/CP1114-like n=1 Tax=Penaeus japonicus TaxID=27405 RepID=UPI001C70F7E6|nr:cuticle protein AM/CP1114-like [Penaeus japonicus]
MKTIAFFLLVAVAAADKMPFAAPPVAILRSDQHTPNEDGAHSFDFEAENGIEFHVSGSQGATGGANSIGDWSYPLPDGSTAEFKFVANENGYQPESSLLPVAPAFPHPIPDFVMRQIEFAEQQRAAEARQSSYEN